MKQSARLQAAISILDRVLTSSEPADSIVTGYFRQCRYMGSTDRRIISEIVYQILRRYEELVWSFPNLPPNPQWGRLLVLAYLSRSQKLSIVDIEALCEGDKFGMAPLSLEERLLLQQAGNLNLKNMPLCVRLNIPDWVLPRLEAAFGNQLEKAMEALNQPAPFDLRVNILKTTRKAVLNTLQSEGFQAAETPWSPVGIRLTERRPLSGHELWKRGEIEVQDEGSQLLALLVDAQPGTAVLDFCAGAGGKTLAMAATMENRGRIVATDTAAWRLQRSRERLRRAGVNNVEFRALGEEGTAKWLKRQAGRFDRVLVDAPCSGSGTWRRNPDLKRRFREQDLGELVAKQQEILTQVVPLVRPGKKGEPGGRLVYATCSLFAEENTGQIQQFLERHPDFRLVSIQDVWASLLQSPCPTSEPMLQLTPHGQGVDGFFVAVMERQAPD